MDIKVLVADDDPIFRELVCDIIKKQGYVAVEACDGQQAIERFFEMNDIDLVILDVMMPECDGWDVLREIREHSDVPVIMLTALGAEHYEVKGLKKGADDYISKPFSYEIFVARINTLLRKLRKERQAELIAGEICIQQATRQVLVLGKNVELNRKEYDLLVYLIKNRNKVLAREQILCSIWGYDYDGESRTIDTHIKTLRAKLLSGGEAIRTVRGSGYMFKVE